MMNQPPQQTPNNIVIGTHNKKQKTLNDSLQLTKEGGLNKINAIKVYTNDKYVIGMVFYYKLADGDYLKAQHNVPEEKKILKKKNHIKSRVFEIGPDDYLLEISGHMDKDKLARITFTSYRGKIGNYGSDLGTPFIYKFQNYTFGAFTTGFRDVIEFLDIPVLPVPQQFLNEFKPITVNVNISDNQHRTQNDKKIDYKPIKYQGVYVSQTTPNTGSFGAVKMPVFNMVSSQPQPQFQQPPQQQWQQPPQQQWQQPPQQQWQQPPQQQWQQPPQQQWQQPPQQQQQNKSQQNSNNVASSKYPEF